MLDYTPVLMFQAYLAQSFSVISQISNYKTSYDVMEIFCFSISDLNYVYTPIYITPISKMCLA